MPAVSRSREDVLEATKRVMQSDAYARVMRKLGSPRWLPVSCRPELRLPVEAVELIVEYDEAVRRSDAYWQRVPLSGDAGNVFDDQSQQVAFEQADKYGMKVPDWLHLAHTVQQLLAAERLSS